MDAAAAVAREIHHHPSMDTLGPTPLMIVAAAGQLDAAAAALTHEHSHVNTQDRFGFTALVKAAAAGHVDIVRLLIKAGAELDIRDRAGSTALTRAVVGDHAAVVAALLEAGAESAATSADKTRKTLLHNAAERGHEGMILKLIRAGALLEARYWDDATPLLLAADTGHAIAVRALVEAGANIEAMDKHCRTALLRAAVHGHFAVVLLLLDHGANAQVCNSEGCTALILAAAKGYKTTAECLVVHGADINAMSRSRGQSALMAAAERDGHEEVVRMLLDHGADRSLLNRDNKTAADLTTNRRIRKLLRLPLLRSLKKKPIRSDKQPEPEFQPSETLNDKDLEQLCDAMEETAFICKRVYDRLQLVQRHYSSSIDRNQQVQTVICSFRSFLRQNVGKHAMVRLVYREENLKTCYDLHVENDKFQLEVSSWKGQWATAAESCV